MTAFEEFQNSLLKQLGYDVAPFEGDWLPKYVYLKDGKFCFLDQYAKNSYRSEESISGDILIQKNDEGYHCCPSVNKDGESILYRLGVKISRLDSKYYILWENNEYTELSYLHDSCFHFCSGDTIEYKITDHYIAVMFHQENNSMMRDDNPYLDAIICREKDIYHLGVKTHFLKDKIVVLDADYDVIVYDNEMNVLYEGLGEISIMEVESKCYLIFPSSCTVYDLTEGKEIRLPKGEDEHWHSVKVYKDIFVLYTEHRNRSLYANDSDSYWDYDYEDLPITNTEGVVYNLQFKLLRRFNVLRVIVGIVDLGDTKVLKVDDSDYNNTVLKLFNVKGENITRHNEDINEDFSVPDITFSSMDGYENLGLTIVRTSMYTPDIINFGSLSKNKVINKCGVYMELGGGDTYEKIIDCKYAYIKSFPLKEDSNVYYVGVDGGEENNKCDLYVNHELFFENYPFNRGHAIEVVGHDYFMKFTDSNSNIGFIRNGEIVFKPKYKEAKVCVCSFGKDGETELEYLFIVSNGELYGICSPSGELILPIEYPIIDIDDNLTIVIAKHIDETEIDENDKSILWDYQMGVGYFSKETNSIEIEKAIVDDNGVRLDDDYVWDGEFKYTKDYYDEWSRKNYSDKDAMYDALGGEMDAIWNLD